MPRRKKKMTPAEKQKRKEHNERTERARKIKRKTKVLPRDHR